MVLDKRSRNILVSSGDYEEEIKYWLDKLAGEVNISGFPANNEQKGYAKGSFSSTVPNDVFQGIKKLSNQSEYGTYVILLSGIKYLLYRYTDNRDILVGMPIFKYDTDDVILNRFLPIRTSIDSAWSFSDFLQAIKMLVLEADNYQNYPLDKIYERLKLGTGEDLDYKTVVLLENIHDKISLQDANVDMVFAFLLTEASLELEVEYNANVYTEHMIKQVFAYLFTYFREVIQNPELRLAEVEILSPAEKEQILADFNNTAADYPKTQTLQGVFEEQVAKTPDNIAIIFANQQLTYRELNTRANQLARVLRSKGVGADSIVGLMVERSLEMVIGIISILKAGGAYLPISPDYPVDRINYMLEDSGTNILLTQKGLLSKLSFTGETIALDEAGLYCGNGANLPSVSHAENLAYVIYTSGSTGKPKGVMIEHYSAINRINWMQDFYHLTPSDVILQKTPFTFDVSVWELVWWFFVGAGVYMLKPGGEKEPGEIVRAIAENKITTMHFVPSMLSVFLQYMENSREVRQVAGLRRVFASGEALHAEHANKFNKLFGEYGVKLINLYGPTEATVDVSYFDCSTGAQLEIVPIGKPIDNINLFVVNKFNKLQPVGVAGELCIAGDGLARGYLNKPELTAEKFVPNPFKPGTRMYRTGDLVRWLPDGNIEFLGRIDHQVKIRGFRIELGEIETELLKYPAVKETVVVAKTNQTGDKYLCAYIVAGEAVTVDKLREHLAQELPDYMIPAYFVQLEQMPLSPNGKADRKALPEPDGNINTGVEYAAPQSETEEIVVKVWQEVLRVEKVGIKDNFFSLGGDSIKAIQVLSRLSQYGLNVEMQELFKYPVIEDLSSYITLGNRKIDQGLIEGAVGFTPMQSWLFAQSFTAKQHFNQAVMLYSKKGFQESVLRKVLGKLVEHHDALRMVVRNANGKRVQFNRGLDGELYSLETIDVTKVDNYRQIIEQHAGRLQQSINLEQGPLVKLGLFKTQARDHLLIVIHHLVVDGVSWRILLQDLFSGYLQASQGEVITFAAKTNSFKEWASGLAVYANSWELLNELEYWRNLEGTEVLPLPKDKTVQDRKFSDHESIQLKFTETETETLLKQVHSAYNTEVNDLLLTALGLAIREWAGPGRVLVNLEGHGRESLMKDMDISRTVGWFTAQYPVILDMSSETDLGCRIKTVKDSLRQITNKGIGHGVLKYLTLPENKQTLVFKLAPEISFNYLGQFDGDVSTELFTISDIPVGKCVSPDMNSLYAIDINGLVAEGRLTLNFTYNAKEYEHNTIIKVAELFREHLIKIIEHCAGRYSAEITPGDFTFKGITLEGLEALEDVCIDIE